MKFEKYLVALIAIGIGLITIFKGYEYGIGSLRRIGAGFYPLMLGVLLFSLGMCVAVLPNKIIRESGSKREIKTYYRPWIALISGVILFIILAKWKGLVLAVFVLVVVAAAGDKKNTFRSCVALGIVAVGFTVIVFHYGIRMPLPLWR